MTRCKRSNHRIYHDDETDYWHRWDDIKDDGNQIIIKFGE